MVALVTPMKENGDIDYSQLATLVEMHVENQTAALVINGTTGESATLSSEEQLQVLTFTIQQAAKRLPVIAGIASNAIPCVIEKMAAAKKAGADASLVLSPTYIKPTQEGMFQYYAAIAKQSPLPIIVYNIPGRTASDILPQTIARLATLSHNPIVGIKEATGDMSRVEQLLTLCPNEFKIYSGDDATALPLLMLGGHGVISVTANVAPGLMAMLYHAVAKRDFQQACAINQRLLALHKALFVETNPIPVKWCLSYLGKIGAGIRLPMTRLLNEHHETLRQAMMQAGIV
jgi:4-hydroxy-tetrahydrodipicolinate synthase